MIKGHFYLIHIAIKLNSKKDIKVYKYCGEQK